VCDDKIFFSVCPLLKVDQSLHCINSSSSSQILLDLNLEFCADPTFVLVVLKFNCAYVQELCLNNNDGGGMIREMLF